MTEAQAYQSRPFGLGALQHRDYMLYFVGQFLSVCGDWLQSTALALLAFRMTRLSAWPALLTVVQFFPSVVLSSLGGALADLYPRRAILFWTQACLLVIALLLAWTAHSDQLTIPVMLCLAAFSGLVQAIDYPARMAYVKDLVGPQDLTSAVGLGALLLNGGRAVGPAVAAGLLTHFSPAECFLGNAASFGCVLFALLLIRNQGRPGSHPKGKIGPGEGLRILGQYPGLLRLLGAIALLGMCGWPFLSILPALAHELQPGNHSLYSWLVSASGVGALACAGLVATADTPPKRRLLTSAGVLGMPAALLLLSSASSPPIAGLACFLAGGSIVMFFSTSQLIIQLQVTSSEQGRVMATLMATLGLAILTGNLLLGPSADHFGLPSALRGMALLASLGTLLILIRRPYS